MVIENNSVQMPTNYCSNKGMKPVYINKILHLFYIFYNKILFYVHVIIKLTSIAVLLTFLKHNQKF